MCHYCFGSNSKLSEKITTYTNIFVENSIPSEKSFKLFNVPKACNENLSIHRFFQNFSKYDIQYPFIS